MAALLTAEGLFRMMDIRELRRERRRGHITRILRREARTQTTTSLQERGGGVILGHEYH